MWRGIIHLRASLFHITSRRKEFRCYGIIPLDALSDNHLINLFFSDKIEQRPEKTRLKGNKMGLLNQKYVIFCCWSNYHVYMNVYGGYKVSQMYSVWFKLEK